MRKLLCVNVAIASILLLCGCSVKEMSTLSDLSKPYTGLYACEEIYLGADDFTQKYEKLYLELGYGGDFKLFYRGADGMKGEYSGTYSVDCKAQEITFSSRVSRKSVSHVFPMKKGKIYIDYKFGGKLLHAVFAMP